ncbi:hypothetical protein ACFV06_38960, partial [Streptomyces sp. NPDC059618]|uniref:hypothetical protein n=1 Tax=Streptomyces sp. NPDC059618 TaxID=3346887 RepID=UPI0036881A3A
MPAAAATLSSPSVELARLSSIPLPPGAPKHHEAGERRRPGGPDGLGVLRHTTGRQGAAHAVGQQVGHQLPHEPERRDEQGAGEKRHRVGGQATAHEHKQDTRGKTSHGELRSVRRDALAVMDRADRERVTLWGTRPRVARQRS